MRRTRAHASLVETTVTAIAILCTAFGATFLIGSGLLHLQWRRSLREASHRS